MNNIDNWPHNTFLYLPNNSPNTLPGVALVFSCTRNDEILVPGLLQNFDFCEFFIAYYDDGTDFEYDESKRHRNLIKAAEEHGAKWVYLTQPTMRLGPGWRDTLAKYLEYPIDSENVYTLTCPVFYFWDYSTHKIRTDLHQMRPIPSFFQISPKNTYGTQKLHHSAIPQNAIHHREPLRRYDFRRLGKEVCLGKADYYENRPIHKRGHGILRDFSHVTVKPFNPNIIKGISENEEKYIQGIKKKYAKYSKYL